MGSECDENSTRYFLCLTGERNADAFHSFVIPNFTARPLADYYAFIMQRVSDSLSQACPLLGLANLAEQLSSSLEVKISQLYSPTPPRDGELSSQLTLCEERITSKPDVSTGAGGQRTV